jgi:hypothetical protein
MDEKVPPSPTKWMEDIVLAYRDASEAIPFGPAAGAEFTERELFHLAPLVCLKRRGVKRTRKNRDLVTEAALSTYVANEQVHGTSLTHSIMAFSLCYLASHYALKLLDEQESENILNFLEEHLNEIEGAIET